MKKLTSKEKKKIMILLNTYLSYEAGSYIILKLDHKKYDDVASFLLNILSTNIYTHTPFYDKNVGKSLIIINVLTRLTEEFPFELRNKTKAKLFKLIFIFTKKNNLYSIIVGKKTNILIRKWYKRQPTLYKTSLYSNIDIIHSVRYRVVRQYDSATAFTGRSYAGCNYNFNNSFIHSNYAISKSGYPSDEYSAYPTFVSCTV